jgi:diadenosine tetraphosphate (Ap4A) HIT family hydrolase
MSCVFCRELNGSRDTNFAKRYPEISSRIVGESASLVAFPCIGQLSPGHFMIVPKLHSRTFRETRLLTPDFQVQFTGLVKHVHALLDRDDRYSLFFEHGAESGADGGCGIYHAHIHVIPNAGHVELNSHIQLSGGSRHRLMDDLWTKLPENGSYTFYGSSTRGFFSHVLDRPLSSQYLRRSVANELNTSSWDWRQAGREVAMIETLNKASVPAACICPPLD